MSSSGSPPPKKKEAPLIGRPDWSANQRSVFLVGKHLNQRSDTDLRKN